MSSQIEDEEKCTKYFLFTLMTEKKLPVVFIPDITYYTVGSVIGKSSLPSTFVYAGKFIKTNELVAIKKINVEFLSFNEIKLVQNEINIVKQIMNPYLISHFVSFVTGYQIISILPLSEYGSCLYLIRKYFPLGLPEVIISFVLKDILKALEFIHMKGIIHRAVRASHILVGSDGHAKLTGFRHAYKKQNENTLLGRMEKVFEFPAYSVSNLKWLSPDILEQNLNGYNEKSDVYSLGVTVCELANGIVPYQKCSLTAMLMEKINGDVPDIYDSSTLNNLCDSLDEDFVKSLKVDHSTKKFSKHLHSFKDMCCLLKPQERPDCSKLSLHPLFNSLGKRRKLFFENISPAVPISEKNFLTIYPSFEISMVEGDCNISGNLFDWKF